MAGNYADVPGHRFVMDRDGTQMYASLSGGAFSQLSSGQVQAFNKDAYDGTSAVWPANASGHKHLIYFPEPRNLSGFFWACGNNQMTVNSIEWSANTTNGSDGTWNTIAGAAINFVNPVAPTYRTGIISVSLSGVRAIRMTFGISALWFGAGAAFVTHLYGEIPTTGSPTRLAVWHPTNDEPISGAYLDWGDSPRSSSADRTFRVKNLSGTLTANTITVSCDSLTDSSPSVAGSHFLSDDGTTFTATESIAALAPGAISSVLTLRRVLASNAPLGVWAPRVHAVASSWT